MFTILNTNDKVKLLPAKELFDVFQIRKFFSDVETRQKFADKLGDSTGIVESIEEKYQFDYFFYLKDGDISPYSIPSQSVYINME